jgi:hypothetical protein
LTLHLHIPCMHRRVYHSFHGVWFLLMLKLWKWRFASWPAHRVVLNYYLWFYYQSATTLVLVAPVTINELDHGVTCKERSCESPKKTRPRPRWKHEGEGVGTTDNYSLGRNYASRVWNLDSSYHYHNVSLLVCVSHLFFFILKWFWKKLIFFYFNFF